MCECRNEQHVKSSMLTGVHSNAGERGRNGGKAGVARKRECVCVCMCVCVEVCVCITHAQ